MLACVVHRWYREGGVTVDDLPAKTASAGRMEERRYACCWQHHTAAAAAGLVAAGARSLR